LLINCTWTPVVALIVKPELCVLMMLGVMMVLLNAHLILPADLDWMTVLLVRLMEEVQTSTVLDQLCVVETIVSIKILFSVSAEIALHALVLLKVV